MSTQDQKHMSYHLTPFSLLLLRPPSSEAICAANVVAFKGGISCIPPSIHSDWVFGSVFEGTVWALFILELLIPVLKIPSEYVLIFSWIYMSLLVAANQI